MSRERSGESKKHVLCLDGGGVRGRFSLQICYLLASNLKKPISQLFDLIAGVSVGAWVGALIATGMLDVGQSQYTAYEFIFSQLPDTFRSKNEVGPALLEPRYNGTGKNALLHRVFKSKRLGDVITPLAVVCCTKGGSPRVFRSWDKKDAAFYLADVLDASSAAPIYFPLVKINDSYVMDGGVLSNKPLLRTYLICKKELFRAETEAKKVKILSIGTSATCELKIQDKDLKFMGLMAWIPMGLFDIMTGAADNTDVEMITETIGEENFMRVFCDCKLVKLDKLEESAKECLENAVSDVWHKEGTKMIQFLDVSS